MSNMLLLTFGFASEFRSVETYVAQSVQTVYNVIVPIINLYASPSKLKSKPLMTFCLSMILCLIFYI